MSRRVVQSVQGDFAQGSVHVLFRRLMNWPRKPAIAVTFVTAMAALLRVFHLGFKSLSLDEAKLYWFANGNFQYILEQNAAGNSAPPLFALLIGAAMNFGTSEAALRTLSCVAGVLAVPAVYLLGKQVSSRRCGILAALLVAVAPSQIQYSQQLREYSLAFLLATVMLLVFFRFLQRQSWTSAASLGLVAAVSLFTQYGLALLFVAINLVFFAVVFRLERPRRAFILWLCVLIVVSFALWAVYQLSLKDQWVAGGRAAYYLGRGYWDGSLGSLARISFFGTEEIFFFAFPTPLIILACALGVVEVTKNHRRWTALWLLLAPIVLTFAAAMLRAYPYLGARQTIFLTPMIYIFAGMGILFAGRQRSSRAVLVVLAVLMVGYGLRYTAKYQLSTAPENIRPITGKLLSLASAGDRIHVHPTAVPAFEYYFQGQTRSWVSAANRPQFAQQLDAVLGQRAKVWLVFSHIRQSELEEVVAYVAARRKVEQVQEEDGAWLYLAP